MLDQATSDPCRKIPPFFIRIKAGSPNEILHVLTQNASRKGNCLDTMENFFGLLNLHYFYIQKFDSMEHFKQEVEVHIHYCNHRRIKEKLKGMSPVDYRVHAFEAA